MRQALRLLKEANETIEDLKATIVHWKWFCLMWFFIACFTLTGWYCAEKRYEIHVRQEMKQEEELRDTLMMKLVNNQRGEKRSK